MPILDDILADFSLEELLGIRRRRSRSQPEDPLSKFLSELIRSGNASLTIRISSKSKEARRDENGNWEESTVSYPNLNHPLAGLLNLPTEQETQTIPTSIFATPNNRNLMSSDLLKDQLLNQFAQENMNIPQNALLPPTFIKGEDILALLLGGLMNQQQGTGAPSAELLNNVSQNVPPVPPTIATATPQPDLNEIIKNLQRFAKGFTL